VIRTVLICVLILSHVSLRAEEPKVVVSTRLIHSHCGISNTHTNACTHFVAEQLSAECVARAGLWAMIARARYVTSIYVVDRTLLRHEYVHIQDMERDVSGYISTLEEQMYPSPEECGKAAMSSRLGLRSRMAQFALASQARRR